MIYEVYLNDKLIYYPNDEDYAIANSVLKTSLNEAGSFECDVPLKNLRYEEVTEGILRSGMIQVLKDGVEIFYGEVREVTQNFDFTKHIYAVGELAFLFDSIQPQKKYTGTPEAMFSTILASHNSQVENRKKFTKGNVLVTDPNNYILRFTNYEDTLTAIRDKMCDKLNGFLKIRKVGSTRYLDLVPLENYGHYCTQEIQFGENLLDYSCNYTSENIATCVIPLGAKLDEEKRTMDAVDGLDEYLTIKSVNNNQDYLVNSTAAARFGYVKVVQKWDDVTVAANLKSKAQAWLTSQQYANMELSLNAIDLNLLDQNIDSFEVGDTIHAWAEPYGMDTTFPVREKTIYLNDLSKNYIVLSNTEISKSYTSQATKTVEALKEEIPQLSPVLKEARDRALAMLLDETQGGHVVYEYDASNSYIEAINICNAATIDASTSRWRWTYNGLGFLTRANISTAWNYSNIPIALTKDGQINADRILTGTLDADSVNVHGKIEATSGFFGSDADTGWQIGNKYISSKNGPTKVNEDNVNGTYVGTDGIVNIAGTSSNRKYARITGGEINTNGILYANQLISRGKVTATGALETNSNCSVGGYISANGNVSSDGRISGGSFGVKTSGGIVEGQSTPAFGFTVTDENGNQKAIALRFQNGLLVATSGF